MPDPNQNNQQPSVTTPVVFPHSDLPPLPPDFQNMPTTETPPVPSNNQPANQTVTIDVNNGSSAPPDIPPMTSGPKKKFGGGKIIATILGLIVLVGGVGAGILLTQQKQLIDQKAGGITCSNDYEGGYENRCRGLSTGTVILSCQFQMTSGGSCQLPATGLGTHSYRCKASDKIGSDGNPVCVSDCFQDSSCGGGAGGGTTTWPANGTSCNYVGGGTGTIGACAKYLCPQGCGSDNKCGEDDPGVIMSFGSCDSAESSISGANYCGQVDTVDTSNRYCIPSNGTKESYINCGSCVNPPVETSSPSPTPVPTPTPTPTPGAPSCIQVKAYDATWNVLDDAQLSALTPESVVNFCVDGMAATGDFDKAQFMINTVLESETTTVRPSSTDFCQPYTILSTDTTVNVKAKIHHATLGWVGESI